MHSKLSEKYLFLLPKKSVVDKVSLKQPRFLYQLGHLLLANIRHMKVHGVDLSGRSVKSSVWYVNGDNLSGHKFGSIRECFSLGPICRFLLGNKRRHK